MKGFLQICFLCIAIPCFAQNPTESAVVSSDPIATRAGMEILNQGGNAFDAAIAMTNALGVKSALSGTWLIHDVRASDSKYVVIQGNSSAHDYLAQKSALHKISPRLEKLNQVQESKPLISQYEDIKIITAPNKSGLAVVMALKILAGFELNDLSDADLKHLIVESIRRVNCDVLNQESNNLEPTTLLSENHIQKLRFSIKMNRATSTASLGCAMLSKAEPKSVNYSVLDEQGNQVAASLTENSAFSAPILFDMKEGVGSLGTSGAYKEPAVLVLSLLTALDDYYPQTWMLAPRFTQGAMADVIEFEKAFPVPLQNSLKLRGHQLREVHDFGDVQGIFWDKENNKVYAASDLRGKGLALVKKVGKN